MQSFILDRHTDPSNPVMKVTQDDKIPIYDSQQDAESDLANLAEGQLVATKDNGNNNRYVLQNEYEANNTYSTNEVNTGKTWIDGKPIYRVIIEKNVTASVTLQNALPPNIAEIVTMGCVLKLTTGSYYIIPQFGGTGYSGYVVANPSNRSLIISTSNYYGVYRISIEYTKTTD